MPNNMVMFTYETRFRMGQNYNQSHYIRKARNLQNKIDKTDSLKKLGFSITLNKMGNMYKPVLYVPKKLLDERGNMPIKLIRQLSGKGKPPPFMNFRPLSDKKKSLIKTAQKKKAAHTKALLLKTGTFASLPKNIQQKIFNNVVVPNRMKY